MTHEEVLDIVNQLSPEAIELLSSKGARWSRLAQDAIKSDVGDELHWLGLTVTYWSPLAIEVAKYLKSQG